MAKQYTVHDGKMTVTLEPMKEGGFLVLMPADPAVLTRAETIPEAFAMARDAYATLQEARAKRGESLAPRRRASA